MDNLFYRKDKKGISLAGVVRKLLSNKRMMLALIIGAPLMLFVLFGNRGVVQRIKLQAQKTALEEKIHGAEAETRRLKASSKALEGNRKAIEKVAREKHGMIREGETVYQVRKK